MTMTLPPGDVMRNADWPSHCSLTLPLRDGAAAPGAVAGDDGPPAQPASSASAAQAVMTEDLSTTWTPVFFSVRLDVAGLDDFGPARDLARDQLAEGARREVMEAVGMT